MSRAHAARNEVDGPEGGSTTVEQMLGSWEPAPGAARELRRLHAAALNTHVARALAAADDNPQSAQRLQELAEQLRTSSWTTPEVAFTQYAILAKGRTPTGEQHSLVLDSLSAIAAGPAPATAVGGRTSMPEWAPYAMRLFEDDQVREQRQVRWELVLQDEIAERECRAALELLADAWPAMAGVVEAYVREILWYTCGDVPASRSLCVAQAFGAVFLHRRADRIEAAEHLAHEATHFELIARMAIDPLIENGDAPARSPFRAEPRPLGRVLHACLVSARLTAVLER